MLSARQFHPWEGGDGLVSRQYVTAHLLLGRALVDQGQPAAALAHFEAARTYPRNLGEGKHLLTSEADLDYYSGLALARAGNGDQALGCWRKAAASPAGTDAAAYYRALALHALGRTQESREALQGLLHAANRLMQEEAKLQYFATSLPNFLLFEDDLQKRQTVNCVYLTGLALLRLERPDDAAAAFRKTLALDVNHLRAQQELECMFSKPSM